MTIARSNWRTNGERLWDSLMRMAEIGPGVWSIGGERVSSLRPACGGPS